MKLINLTRLAKLRDHLATNEPDGNWTQASVGKATGLTQNAVARLEKPGTGSIEGLLSLLSFYHQKGFNIRWVLLDDNSSEPLYISEEEEKSTNRAFIADISQQLTDFLGTTELSDNSGNSSS